jgi:hypothetical protein
MSTNFDPIAVENLKEFTRAVKKRFVMRSLRSLLIYIKHQRERNKESTENVI